MYLPINMVAGTLEQQPFTIALIILTYTAAVLVTNPLPFCVLRWLRSSAGRAPGAGSTSCRSWCPPTARTPSSSICLKRSSCAYRYRTPSKPPFERDRDWFGAPIEGMKCLWAIDVCVRSLCYFVFIVVKSTYIDSSNVSNVEAAYIMQTYLI